MNVGNSVRVAINDWEQGETEAAVLHACNAVDGTAAKTFPTEPSNNSVGCSRDRPLCWESGVVARPLQASQGSFAEAGRAHSPGGESRGAWWGGRPLVGCPVRRP